jgi:hypothetical protein
VPEVQRQQEERGLYRPALGNLPPVRRQGRDTALRREGAVMDGNMNRALHDAAKAEPTETELAEAEYMAAEAERAAAERRTARTDAALQAGWVIRFDCQRLEYAASRELLTARTLDGVLDEIEGARKDGPA